MAVPWELGPWPCADDSPCLAQDRIDGITIQARQFQEAGHFDAENIKKKQEALVARYEALKDPMVARKQKLADSLRLQQLFRDVEDEETWIREKEPVAASTNRGGSKREPGVRLGPYSASFPQGSQVERAPVAVTESDVASN